MVNTNLLGLLLISDPARAVRAITSSSVTGSYLPVFLMLFIWRIMISPNTLSLFDKISLEIGISIREMVEEFNEPASKIEAEPADSLEQRLRTYFGLPPIARPVAPLKTAPPAHPPPPRSGLPFNANSAGLSPGRNQACTITFPRIATRRRYSRKSPART